MPLFITARAISLNLCEAPYVLMSKYNKSPLTMSENLFKKLFSYEFHYAIYTNGFS